MSWLNFLKHKPSLLKHQFGRGINANLADNEENLYDRSTLAFENQNILQAYEYYFKSLINFSNDKSNNNIIINKTKKRLNFELYQGSARVSGYVTQEHLYAEAILTKKANTHVALKRYILERNYQLTYANYFTDDTYIKLKLYLDNITMNPQKIFYPLRELVLNADFDKEYMRSEFSNVILEDIQHLENINEDELQIKYNFLQDWINELENKISTLPSNDNAGMQSFLYLNILFKIDYLIVPKYEIYQKINKRVQSYFNNENVSSEAKNEELKLYIYKLQNMEFKDFRKKFYTSKYTYNPVEKTSQEEITNFINESLIKIRWYKNNRYNQIIETLYIYISFYILYNYGVNTVIKSLLHTLVEVYNPKYFKSLSYETLYDIEKKDFCKKLIISRVDGAIKAYQNRFKSLELFGNKLNFSSLNEFSNSYYLQINELNFEEI
ncbi:MAG: hypothetical protein COB17_03125 [Sulfurimonas sp.]|nr:MAG: hypothetical protein COB17_03125 [Sulfurimonas sp.]